MVSQGFLFSEPSYWFYIFGGVMYWPKSFESVGLENRDSIKTATDIRTQVVLGVLSGVDSFSLQGMYIEFMFIITLKIKRLSYRNLISAYHK